VRVMRVDYNSDCEASSKNSVVDGGDVVAFGLTRIVNTLHARIKARSGTLYKGKHALAK